MEFSPVPTKGKPSFRHGTIKFSECDGLVKESSPSYSLPLCLQYTKDGFVPHLTWDLLKHVPDNNAPVIITLCTMYDLIPTLLSSGQSLSDFISSDFNRPTFLTAQDVLADRRQGFNSTDFIPIWTESGRKNIYPMDLMKCVDAFKPNTYHLLADGETFKDTSGKRLEKSVLNTTQLMQKSFNIKEYNFNKKPVFGSIVGGWNLKQRMISIDHIKSYPIDGFVIDGLLADDLLNDSISSEEFSSLISKICSHLPFNKPRAIFGPLKPERLIDAISAGIDIFDSSYCSYLTSMNTAVSIKAEPGLFKTTSTLLNLADESLKKDFTVIKKNCKCFTCSRGFTRAYLNHLVKVREMLAPILINLHNLFEYYDFINQIILCLNTSEESN